MTFSSIDDLVAEVTGGKFLKMPYQKTSNNGIALTAGFWAETLQWAGSPSAVTVTGTAGTGVALSDATSGAWYHGGNVTSDTKHVLNMIASTPTTTMCPATLVLCDFLAMYPSLVVTGTPTTITPVALPRYAGSVGGVEMICSVCGALGATQPALTFTGKNTLGVSHAAPSAHTSPVASAPLSALFQTDGGPFVRRYAGDLGWTTLESYTLATGTTGTATVFLVKPLLSIPLLALNTPSERDYVYQLPSLPKILDGACLGFMVNVGGAMIASAKLFDLMDVAWG